MPFLLGAARPADSLVNQSVGADLRMPAVARRLSADRTSALGFSTSPVCSENLSAACSLIERLQSVSTVSATVFGCLQNALSRQCGSLCKPTLIVALSSGVQARID